MYNTYKNARAPYLVSNIIKKVLNFLDREFEEDASVIKYNADFISLYLLAKHLLDNYAITLEKVGLKEFFIKFAIKVGEVESSEIEENAPYYDYKTYRKTSADSRNSIERRFNIILSKFLEFNQKLQPKDSERNFNYWEKLAIYWRDKGICQLKITENCKGKTPFEEGTVDHKVPHSKGGPTTIENGQWVCIPCNLKKLNKLI
jgi:5-methylcytosine-specific restriction endonuclease McrA